MLRIEPLSKSHDREKFDCGSEPLNQFLKQTARQHAERGISRTFVLVEDDEVETAQTILGFFSLCLCQIESASLPDEIRRRFPRTVPAVRLGRLAVTRQHQGRGFGKDLMIAAMAKSTELFARGGGIGLFLDAKDLRAKEFHEKVGFISLPGNELELFLPVNSIQEILASAG